MKSDTFFFVLFKSTRSFENSTIILVSFCEFRRNECLLGSLKVTAKINIPNAFSHREFVLYRLPQNSIMEIDGVLLNLQTPMDQDDFTHFWREIEKWQTYRRFTLWSFSQTLLFTYGLKWLFTTDANNYLNKSCY